MKHVFIVNVNSNVGKIANKVRDIEEICKSLEVDYEFIISESKEMTMDIAKRYKDDFCVVYAVGGDGTINAVLNSLMGGKAFLGVVPMGSGNDFYKSIEDMKRTVLECNVMKVNDMYCINIFSVGLDALICAAAEKMKRLNIPGNQVYKLGMAYAFFKHQNEPMVLKTDCESFYSPNMDMVTVCNGKYYGNGYKIAPKADITREGAELYMVAGLKKYEMPSFLKTVLDGTHEENECLMKIPVKKLEIVTDNPIIANVDGEVIESDTYAVDANAGRIKVVKNDRVINLVRRLNK